MNAVVVAHFDRRREQAAVDRLVEQYGRFAVSVRDLGLRPYRLTDRAPVVGVMIAVRLGPAAITRQFYRDLSAASGERWDMAWSRFGGHVPPPRSKDEALRRVDELVVPDVVRLTREQQSRFWIVTRARYFGEAESVRLEIAA